MIGQVPYVISMGHPDYKRPRVTQEFHSADSVNQVVNACINHLARYIIDGLPRRSWTDMDQIHRYHYERREAYIENPFWEAKIFLAKPEGDNNKQSGWVDIGKIDPNYNQKALDLNKQLLAEKRKNIKRYIKEDAESYKRWESLQEDDDFAFENLPAIEIAKMKAAIFWEMNYSGNDLSDFDADPTGGLSLFTEIAHKVNLSKLREAIAVAEAVKKGEMDFVEGLAKVFTKEELLSDGF